MVLFANNLCIVLDGYEPTPDVEDRDTLEQVQFCFGIPDQRVAKLTYPGEILRAIQEEYKDPGPNLQVIHYKAKPSKLFDRLKKETHYIEAGGGICLTSSQVLMIKRKGKWDLPKGKLDPGESPEDGAVREVEEETGLKPRVLKPILPSYHFYAQGDEMMFKKTYWYLMRGNPMAELVPQAEEEIEAAGWYIPDEVVQLLRESYASLQLQYFRTLPDIKELIME